MINPVTRSPQLFLVIFSLLVFGAGIWGSSVITMSDESDYIQSSQEMFRSGDLLSPTLRGELRFTKPPLLYWMVAASYKLFGVSYFSARLPMVLCAIITIVFVYRLGLLLFDRQAALLGALLTATSFGILKFSKVAMMESPLTMTMVLAFYYFIRFYREERPGLLLVSFLFLGLSSQLKSPVYPIICILAMVLFLASEGALRRLFMRQSLWAAALFLLLTVPWYLIMIIKHGELFTRFYYHEHFVKFYEATDYRMRVAVGLLLYALPWTPYLIEAVWQTARNGRYRAWPVKFLLIVVGLFLVIFILPKSKGLYYAVPLLPYCGLLSAAALTEGVRSQRFWDWLTAAILLSIAVLIAVAVVALGSEAIGSMIAIALIGTAAWLLAARSRIGPAAVLFGLSALPIYLDLLPAINLEAIPARQALAIAGQRPIHTYDLTPLRISRALGRTVTEIRGADKLKQALDDGDYVIIKQPLYDALDETLRSDTVILLRWPKWSRKIPVATAVDAILHQRLDRVQTTLYLIAHPDRQSATPPPTPAPE